MKMSNERRTNVVIRDFRQGIGEIERLSRGIS